MFVVVRASRGRRSGDVILDLAARGFPVCDLCWQQRLAVLRGSRAVNSASLREIPHRLMKTEVHYRVHKSLPLDSLLSQINPFPISPYAVTRPLFDAGAFYEASQLWIFSPNLRKPANLSCFVQVLRVSVTA